MAQRFCPRNGSEKTPSHVVATLDEVRKLPLEQESVRLRRPLGASINLATRGISLVADVRDLHRHHGRGHGWITHAIGHEIRGPVPVQDAVLNPTADQSTVMDLHGRITSVRRLQTVILEEGATYVARSAKVAPTAIVHYGADVSAHARVYSDVGLNAIIPPFTIVTQGYAQTQLEVLTTAPGNWAPLVPSLASVLAVMLLSQDSATTDALAFRGLDAMAIGTLTYATSLALGTYTKTGRAARLIINSLMNSPRNRPKEAKED